MPKFYGTIGTAYYAIYSGTKALVGSEAMYGYRDRGEWLNRSTSTLYTLTVLFPMMRTTDTNPFLRF